MQSNKTLNHISLLFFAFVAIVVVINLFTTNNYGRANAQVAQMLEERNMFNYHQLRALLNNETHQWQLIDVREPDRFEEGHLPGAINIPFSEIIDHARQIKRLNQTPVLYADHEADAHAARFMLYALGYQGPIMVMGGNYATALEFAVDDFRPSFANYQEEKARFDFLRYMQQQTRTTVPSATIPAARQQTQAAQGGC